MFKVPIRKKLKLTIVLLLKIHQSYVEHLVPILPVYCLKYGWVDVPQTLNGAVHAIS